MREEGEEAGGRREDGGGTREEGGGRREEGGGRAGGGRQVAGKVQLRSGRVWCKPPASVHLSRAFSYAEGQSAQSDTSYCAPTGILSQNIGATQHIPLLV